MKSRIRVQQDNATKQSESQTKIPDESSFKQAEIAEMDVVFFKSDVDFQVDEDDPENGVATKTKLPESLFDSANAAAQRADISLAEFFEQAIADKITQLETGKLAPKIPRGFFMINLSEWEKKELRKLSRECGIELRNSLKRTLHNTQADLRCWARVKRLTGKNPFEMFYGPSKALN